MNITSNGLVCRNCGKPIFEVNSHRWAHSAFGFWCATAVPRSSDVGVS